MPPPEQQTAQTSVPVGSGRDEATGAPGSVDTVGPLVEVWSFI
jgi:hypothetical protein